jgi:hypothetical protein
MAEINWNEQDLDKYNFAVKPGAPDYDEQIVECTLEQHIQQAKAFRSWDWDKYGTTGELGPEHFEMMDDGISQMEQELVGGEFNETFDRLSDDQVISTARSWLVNLTANDNEVARKMGMTDEQIDEFRAKIADLGRTVEDERKATWAKEKDRVKSASEDLLKILGPSAKLFILHPPKPPTGSDKN